MAQIVLFSTWNLLSEDNVGNVEEVNNNNNSNDNNKDDDNDDDDDLTFIFPVRQ